MSPIEIIALLQQLESVTYEDVKAIPDDLRSRLSKATRNVNLVLETPSEAISRVLLAQVGVF